MIVKIPLYFEFDENFKPNEVEEVIRVIQSELTQDLLKMQGINFKFNSFNPLDGKIKCKLLTFTQVKNRVSKQIKSQKIVLPPTK
jgi:hypothetical protein